jgi:hypothetical protein
MNLIILVFICYCRFRLKISVGSVEKETIFLLSDRVAMEAAPYTCDLLMSLVGFVQYTRHVVVYCTLFLGSFNLICGFGCVVFSFRMEDILCILLRWMTFLGIPYFSR